MHEEEIENLKEELKQFKEEKEKIRKLIGQIGGADSDQKEDLITMIFIVSLLIIFIIDISHYLFKLHFPFPPLFIMTLGILLVSIKIIWMMKKQAKVEHFQFWILNSIEFRLNDLSKKLSFLTKQIEEKEFNN